jgi:hypothetical protein
MILVRVRHRGQQLVDIRRRQLKLVMDAVLGMATFLLFGGAFLVTLYMEITPDAGDRIPMPLESTIRHGGALVFMLVVTAIFTLGGLLSALSAIRKWRNKT